LHGNGFVARLSGATAEFIHILSLMTIGEKPFTIDREGNLNFNLKPVIPGWLFTDKPQKRELLIDGKWQNIEFTAGSFSFMFLGNILITYLNPHKTHTYGDTPLIPAEWTLTDHKGKITTLKADRLTGETAQKVRNGYYNRMIIKLNT
jgi:hypothetical protein